MKKQKNSPTEAARVSETKLNFTCKNGIKKRLINTIKSKSGFSLMEAIVATLIFTMLTTTAFGVIRTSLVITGNVMASATESQERVNDLVFDNWTGTQTQIVFSFEDSDGIPVTLEHSIDVVDEDGFFVFRPAE